MFHNGCINIQKCEQTSLLAYVDASTAASGDATKNPDEIRASHDSQLRFSWIVEYNLLAPLPSCTGSKKSRCGK